MQTTIVWATDGSEHATRALTHARSLLGDSATLIAVHIVQDPPPHINATTPRDPGGALQKLVADLSEEGLEIALKVADYVGSQPARAIAEIAREVGADVIIVGTRGYSPVHGAFVGSVTQSLLHVAPCPVLAVPPVDQLTEDRPVGSVDRRPPTTRTPGGG
jgi:nucleotide-binding universal stress UspA family protein